MLKRINLRKITILLMIIYFILEMILGTVAMATEGNAYAEENLQYQSLDENRNLKIYSEAAILIEKTTGEILYEKNAYDKKYPASTTKILTAILAIENCDLQEKAIASEYAVNSVKSGYTIADIQVGESFTVQELLEVMMLQSANEAATILAEHVSGSIENFTRLMNQKAKEIGCQNTHFVNANGAHDENHYSTAYDMAQIASYCMKNETFKNISTKMECSLPTSEIWQEERIFKNTNSLMNPNSRYYYPYCTGLKTGFTTPAKNCLIATSNKDGFELISVILHPETTYEGLSASYLDTINLSNYGYKQFVLEDIQEEYDLIAYTDLKEKNTISSRFQHRDNHLQTSNLGEVNAQELEDGELNSKNGFSVKNLCIVFIVIMIMYKKRKMKLKQKTSKKSVYSKLYDFKYDI